MEFFEKMDDFVCIFWIEIASRLIGDDDIRMVYEGSGYRRTLELSPRERLYKFIFFHEESDLCEYFRNSLVYDIVAISRYLHSK
jgi:hypothetical protein